MSQVSFVIELESHHDGQEDFNLLLSCEVSQIIMGHVSFSKKENELCVQYIHVDPCFRRQGHGLSMLLFLKDAFPDSVLTFNELTHDGSKLVTSLGHVLFQRQEACMCAQNDFS